MKKLVSILAIIALLSALVTVPAEAAPSITDVTDEDLSPITGGVYGMRVRVFGTGETAGMDVNLYWDALRAWDGEKGLLNTSEALPSGDFEIWFDVPKAVKGSHYLWFRDTDSPAQTFGPVTFTVGESLVVNPKSGLKTDLITLKGYGFGKQVNVNTIQFGGSALSTTPSVPVTDSLGYWQATFNVPDRPDNTYTVTAQDASGNSGSTIFKVGPAISIDLDQGPVGTVVEVSGRGFTNYGTIDSVTLEGFPCGVRNAGDLDINYKGEVEFELIVPTMGTANKVYLLEVEDDGGKSAAIDFLVKGLTYIELEPQFGPPGSSVGIHGVNFAKISGSDVVVNFAGAQRTFDTNSNGEFSGTLTVPAISNGNYVVEATQQGYNIEASESFRVGTMIVILAPKTGPTGTKVTLTGTGFSPAGEWEAYFDSVEIFENEAVSGDTTLFGTFYVPTIDAAKYTVTVVDVEEDIEVKAEFTVTASTQVSLSPSKAPVGFNVSVEGTHFAESNDAIDVDFLLYNSTHEWAMDVREGTSGVKTDEDGGFTAWWVVPAELSIGGYTVNATDEEGLYAQASFEVISKYTSIAPSKVAYEREDTVRFDIESSFQETGSYIMIWDADGDFVWRTDDLNTWIKVDVTYVAPFFTQTAGGNPLILDSDAPLGTWVWTWYDSDDEVLASGGFLVELPSDDGGGGDGVSDIIIEQLQDDLQDLEDDVSTLSGQLQSALASLQAQSDDTADSLDELESQVEDAADDAAESKEDAQAAQALASEAKTTAEGAATTASEAKTTADLARDEVEEALAEAERALKAARGQSLMVYAALGLALVAIAMVFVGPIRLSRAP